MRSRIVLAIAGWLTLGGLNSPAQNVPPVPSTAVFALVAPGTAAALATKKATPEALAVLKAANDGLTATPHPLPRVHTEGTLPHKGIYDESKVAYVEIGTALNLAIAYRLTADGRYLHTADAYLSAWASVYRVSLNPIDENQLQPLIIAYDLVKADLPDATREKMVALLRRLGQGYAQEVAKKGKDAGNWQSHRIRILTLAAFALGDDGLIGKAHEAFSKHLKLNIYQDGSVYDFYQRDALHYVTYDLDGLTVACLAAKMHGQDWFNEAAPGSVAKAIDWLLPFATGQKTHVEFVHSKVRFDQQRAGAGLTDYSHHPWEPGHGVRLLTLAAAIDPARRAVCQQVAAATKTPPPDWAVLLFWPDK